MSEQLKHGGPAFPATVLIDGETYIFAGQTLRDHFAGQALVGFQSFVRGGWTGTMASDHAKHVADNCYALADAMLEARKQ